MPEPVWAAGTPVQVRNRFDGSWASGFDVAEELTEEGPRAYRLLRRSDRAVLPASFPSAAIRLDADWAYRKRRQPAR